MVSMSSPEQATPNSWIRVIPLGGETWLDIVGSSLFVCDSVGPKREVDPASPIGLLPLLERPRDTVLAELSGRKRDLSVSSGSLVERVPLGVVPAAAVSTRLDYWVQLALDWHSDHQPRMLTSVCWRDWPMRSGPRNGRVIAHGD